MKKKILSLREIIIPDFINNIYVHGQAVTRKFFFKHTLPMGIERKFANDPYLDDYNEDFVIEVVHTHDQGSAIAGEEIVFDVFVSNKVGNLKMADNHLPRHDYKGFLMLSFDSQGALIKKTGNKWFKLNNFTREANLPWLEDVVNDYLAGLVGKSFDPDDNNVLTSLSGIRWY